MRSQQPGSNIAPLSPLHCLEGRLVGFLEFRDSALAASAISLYNGWKGWGHLGLAMKFVQPAPVLLQPMLKRERDGPGVWAEPQPCKPLLSINKSGKTVPLRHAPLIWP